MILGLWLTMTDCLPGLWRVETTSHHFLSKKLVGNEIILFANATDGVSFLGKENVICDYVGIAIEEY